MDVCTLVALTPNPASAGLGLPRTREASQIYGALATSHKGKSRVDAEADFDRLFIWVSFHFVPLTVEVSILSLLFPIWPLDRIPDFHLGSVCGESFHFESAGSTKVPMCPAPMHCCHYVPNVVVSAE